MKARQIEQEQELDNEKTRKNNNLMALVEINANEEKVNCHHTTGVLKSGSDMISSFIHKILNIK